MIKTQFALCTKRVIQDTQENMVSLIDVIEEIGSPAFPIVLPRLSMVWVLEKDIQDAPVHTGSLVIYRDEQQLQEFPLEINFQNSNRARTILVIAGMAIQQPGIIKISFRLNGTELAAYSFPVTAHAQQLNTGGQPSIAM